MRTLLTLLACLCLLVSSSYAQESDEEIQKMIADWQFQFENEGASPAPDSVCMGLLLDRIGLALYNLGSYSASIEAYRRCFEFRTALLAGGDRSEVNLEGIIRASTNVGNFLQSRFNRYELAKPYIDSSIVRHKYFIDRYGFSMIPRRLGRSYKVSGQINKEIAGMDIAREDYLQALHYFEVAGALSNVPPIYNDLSDLLVFWEESDSAAHYAQLAIDGYEQILKDDPSGVEPIELKRTYSNLGIACRQMGRFEEAIAAFDQARSALYLQQRADAQDPDFESQFRQWVAALPQGRSVLVADIREVADSNTALDYAKIYHNLTEVYLGMNDLGLAEGSLQKADRFLAKLLADPASVGQAEKYQQAYGNWLWATWSQAKGRYAEAVSYCDAAMAGYLDAESPLGLDGLPPVRSSEYNVQEVMFLLEILHLRGHALAADRRFPEAAVVYDTAQALIDRYRLDFQTEGSKMQFGKIARRVYQGAVALCVQRQEIDKAYELSEKSRSFTLLEAMKHEKALQELRIAPELIEADRRFRTEIRYREATYLEVNDEREKIAIRDEIRLLRDSLGRNQRQLEQNADYRALAVRPSAVPVRQLARKVLDRDQVLVEYFIGAEQLTIFTASRNSAIRAQRVDIGEQELEGLIDSMVAAIRVDQTGNSFVPFARRLYELLWQPVVAEVGQLRAVIIPDGKLNYLPFGALLEGEVDGLGSDYVRYPFLIKSTPFSICYSASILQEMKTRQPVRKAGLLAMAPAFPEPYLLSDTQWEMESIAGLFGNNVDTLSGSPATLGQFLRRVNGRSYDWIHLATHGEANSRQPSHSWVSFSQQGLPFDPAEKLFAYQLLGLKLDGASVTLSACETNYGPLKRGEGLLTLARGFAHAGAKKILCTYWKVPQQSTPKIMKGFYERAKGQRMTADNALQKSVEEFIRYEGGHPFQWAGIVAIGSVDPTGASGSAWWYGLAGLVFLGGLWAWRIRNRAT